MSSPGEYLLDAQNKRPHIKAIGEDVPIRKFETGATRDTDNGKFDYEGFLSPAVIRRYAQFMHFHRKQRDGSLRSSDNWQKGIDKDVYMKSLLRHVMDAWLVNRGQEPTDPTGLQDILCAIIFNAMGMLYEEMGLRSGNN